MKSMEKIPRCGRAWRATWSGLTDCHTRSATGEMLGRPRARLWLRSWGHTLKRNRRHRCRSLTARVSQRAVREWFRRPWWEPADRDKKRPPRTAADEAAGEGAPRAARQ